MTALDAYLEGVHYGVFDMPDTGPATFTYAESAPESPISLSLPRHRPATRTAATNFLENLLPDRAAARERMAAALGAASTNAFDLLAAAGGDVAGGLVLVPAGQPIPNGPIRLDPALERDVAGRISALKNDPDAWVPTDAPARFSLAGSQAKFALASIDGEWYWSNYSLPSTHIIKPANPRMHELEAAEAETLKFAADSGINASVGAVLHVEDQTAFITERFDRVPGDGIAARRVHAEDFAQATGLATDRKYRMTAKQAIKLMAAAGDGSELAYEFVTQLVFNTVTGNADAHAKNYSILMRPHGIELAPLYDAVPVSLYPEFDQNLAMDISGARRPVAVTLDHWRRLATTSGLDVDRVEAEVLRVADAIEGNLDAAWPSLRAHSRDELRAFVAGNISTSRGSQRTITTPPTSEEQRQTA